MIDLTKLEAPSDRKRPVIMTIFGVGGVGKTTLGAMFPAPVFLQFEEGSKSIEHRNDVALFPLANTTAFGEEAINALGSEQHSFKTLVVDSITQFSVMVEKEILADSGAKSLNQAFGGYGAGQGACAEKHREFRDLCGDLATHKGMNIVFIAHADSEDVDLPDQPKFKKYTLRMNHRYVQHFTDNTDAVCMVQLATFTSKNEDRQMALTDGSREIICHPQPSSVSKNRFGVNQPIPFSLNGEFPFAKWME